MIFTWWGMKMSPLPFMQKERLQNSESLTALRPNKVRYYVQKRKRNGPQTRLKTPIADKGQGPWRKALQSRKINNQKLVNLLI